MTSTITKGDVVLAHGSFELHVHSCGTVTPETAGSMTNRVYTDRESVVLTHHLQPGADQIPMRVAAVAGSFARLEPLDPNTDDEELVRAERHLAGKVIRSSPAPFAWPVTHLTKIDQPS